MIDLSATGRPTVAVTVRRLTRIAPRVTRLVVHGPAVAQFDPGPFTDTYVRFAFPSPGVTYPPGFDARRIRAELPRAAWPRTRTYTVRSLDRSAGELAVDIVDHGSPGLTPSWLASAKPGDRVLMQSPYGLYRPAAGVDWHLLAGDSVVLPAIAVTLEAMAPGTRAKVLLEVTDAADEQPLPTAADAEVQWIHRARGGSLALAVRSLPFEPGVVQAFVHGEGKVVQALRRHLMRERKVDKDLLSISGYWRRGLNDEEWRRLKAVTAAR
jgi:NADPH-dependent ferric siderophore reductase